MCDPIALCLDSPAGQTTSIMFNVIPLWLSMLLESISVVSVQVISIVRVASSMMYCG